MERLSQNALFTFFAASFGALTAYGAMPQVAKSIPEPPSTEAVYDCTVTREFVTSLNFLLEKTELRITRDQAVKIAERAAQGCTDSAGRFIGVTQLLLKAGVDGKGAVDLGLSFAQASNERADAFVGIFKRAFPSDGLDLDLKASIDVARSLSLDFAGRPEVALEDFEDLTKFCLGRKGLNLPRPKCGEMAARIVLNGAVTKEGVAESFIDAFEFLTEDDDGPRLTTYDALKLAEQLIAVSPYAPENFVDAYLFATSKDGLGLTRDDAVKFASSLAAKTVARKDSKGEDQAETR